MAWHRSVFNPPDVFCFLSFPAILKGWLDRVWTPGFAYDLTPDAWRGDINGRQPKLRHTKALIIQTTIFDKRAYDARPMCACIRLDLAMFAGEVTRSQHNTVEPTQR
jgi:putative NADPH-quinone reductase